MPSSSTAPPRLGGLTQAGLRQSGIWTQAAPRPASRLRLQLAFSAFVGAAYAHYSHQALPKTAASKRGVTFDCTTPTGHRSTAQLSARRGNVRRYATSPESSTSREEKEEKPQDETVASDTSSSSREAAELSKITDINTLMRHPALMKHIKAPRHPIILCHGLYGFDVRGPFLGLEIHYWASILDILRKKVGADVIVRGVPGTGAIADRAQALHKFLCSPEAGVTGKEVNFIGHSMGGLDARYLIGVIKPAPEQYRPVSLTTLSTPHLGSPFMDWCNANIGTGNDRVEKEIREARDKVPAQPARKSEQAGNEEHEGDAEEDFRKHEVKKVPFSLKTPLFVRPSKKQKDQEKMTEQSEGITEGVTDKLQTAVSGVTAGLVQLATTPRTTSSSTETESKTLKREAEDDSKDAPAEKKRKSSGSSSLLDFSLFNRALSSLGGSFSSYMLSMLDQPAYAMLSTRYMAQVFNPMVPDDPNVAYFSIAARKRSLPIYHPLWLPKLVLDAAAESRSAGGERDGSADALGGKLQGNDGLVSVESAKWGEFLGVMEGCDHWDLRGSGAPRWNGKVNPQTGKPLAKEDNKEADKETKKPHEASKKESDSGWSDINSLVRNLFSARASSKTKEEEDNATKQAEQKKEEEDRRQSEATAAAKEEQDSKDAKESDEKSDATSMLKEAVAAVIPGVSGSKHDQGLIDEVAAWISDRLPQGDEGRRAEAEKEADAQDQERQSHHSKEASSSSQSEEESDAQDPRSDTDSSSSSPSDSSSSTPPTSPDGATSDGEQALAKMKMMSKLRREAAWEEELGHDDKARRLRRELAWHRSEWDRASSSGKDGESGARKRETDWDKPNKAASKQKSDASKAKAGVSDMSSADELERFWVAVCRHLWAQGF